MKLEDKVVFITGGSRGIGAEVHPRASAATQSSSVWWARFLARLRIERTADVPRACSYGSQACRPRPSIEAIAQPEQCHAYRLAGSHHAGSSEHGHIGEAVGFVGEVARLAG